MAKRFTDTFKWQRPWFRNLPPPYRELWLYMLDMCDTAGIWYVDIQMAELVLNCKIEIAEAMKHFGKQIHKIDESRWFIKDFIPFQYGKLSKSRFHESIKATLKSFRLKVDTLSIPYRQGTLGTPKVKDKVLEDVKEVKQLGDGTEGVTEIKRLEWFNKIWLRYPKERRHGKPEAIKRFLKNVPDLETAKRCARALESYLASDTVKRGYLMRASKWFDEWEDHIDEKRDSAGIYSATIETRPDHTSAGIREQTSVTNDAIRKLADSKALGHQSPADDSRPGGN